MCDWLLKDVMVIWNIGLSARGGRKGGGSGDGRVPYSDPDGSDTIHKIPYPSLCMRYNTASYIVIRCQGSERE